MSRLVEHPGSARKVDGRWTRATQIRAGWTRISRECASPSDRSTFGHSRLSPVSVPPRRFRRSAVRHWRQRTSRWSGATTFLSSHGSNRLLTTTSRLMRCAIIDSGLCAVTPAPAPPPPHVHGLFERTRRTSCRRNSPRAFTHGGLVARCAKWAAHRALDGLRAERRVAKTRTRAPKEDTRATGRAPRSGRRTSSVTAVEARGEPAVAGA